LLSLLIGSLLGLTQFRIKRLYAYSTISHLGFILLALSVSNIQSIQAFFFYLIQYSLSNLNAFIILISIGYVFFSFTQKINKSENNEYLNDLKDINYSPIQLIYQLKGFFKINPLLSLSLAITLFSFIGVPPLIGFFGKQMVLSAALDEGYTFITLIAILTSVISAVYYLVLIKNIFFEENNYELNSNLNYRNDDNTSNKYPIRELDETNNSNLLYIDNYIMLSSSLTNIIAIITLIILLFILIPKEFVNLTIILSLSHI